MSAWAKPGVKVVCVSAFSSNKPDEAAPQVGETYTIREVKFYGRVSVLLEEIVNPAKDTVDGYIERPFIIDRFRPLVSHSLEQDVAKFRHLLTPSPIDAGLVPAGVELDA